MTLFPKSTPTPIIMFILVDIEKVFLALEILCDLPVKRPCDGNSGQAQAIRCRCASKAREGKTERGRDCGPGWVLH